MTKQEAIDVLKSECYVFNPLNFDRTTLINTALDVAIESLKQPYDQVKWERDIAISQLEELGYSLGEKQEPCVTMRDLSEEELKHFAEEMKKVRPQVIEQEPRWIPVSARLPEGATNGDMIKAMFPNIEIEGIGGITGLECVAVSIGLGISYFALDWWSAPYKAESEEEK